jgi:hypothetical protein
MFSYDNINYKGSLINETIEYKDIIDKKTKESSRNNDRYHYNKIELNPEKVKKAVDFMLNTELASIPLDSLKELKNNHMVFHCNSLSFEFRFDTNYIDQGYVCLNVIKHLTSYSETIISNYDFLKEIFNLDSCLSAFIDLLPNGQYYAYNHGLIYTFTDKQNESYKKSQPKRDYLNAVKDTIDQHLNAWVSKIQFDTFEYFSCNRYNIDFNKKGKIHKIHPIYTKVGILDFDIYLENYYERFICKRMIKKSFRKFDLSFLNLKYGFRRELSFSNNNTEAIILDHTLY